MKINVKRYLDDGDTTMGLMFINGKYVCETLEDEHRNVKVRGETRIPEGTYKRGFRETLSGMTEKYRAKYDFFKWHLHVKDVPGFKYVYIHTGSTDDHTDGCLLIGGEKNMKAKSIYESRNKYRELYPIISMAIEQGEPVTITYENIEG